MVARLHIWVSKFCSERSHNVDGSLLLLLLRFLLTFCCHFLTFIFIPNLCSFSAMLLLAPEILAGQSYSGAQADFMVNWLQAPSCCAVACPFEEGCARGLVVQCSEQQQTGSGSASPLSPHMEKYSPKRLWTDFNKMFGLLYPQECSSLEQCAVPHLTGSLEPQELAAFEMEGRRASNEIQAQEKARRHKIVLPS
jgi:hypothetical protein